jgi:CHAD domain-containing protein
MSEPLRALVPPVMARPPLIDGLMTREEACRVILFDCLAHLSANVEPVKNCNPEGLHQLRVALRRLRAAFATFGDALPNAADLKQQARTIGRAVAPARDCDVFLEELFAPAIAKMEPLDGFNILRSRAEKARARAWSVAVRQASSPEFARFEDDIAAAAQRLSWPTDDTILLGVLVPAIMEAHRRRAMKRGRALEEMDAHQCHRLRIALKRLRYGAEFFAPLYKRKKVRGWLDPLKQLQDRLGHLNDAAQVRTVLGRLMMEEPASAPLQAELSHAAGLIQGWHQARADRVAGKILKQWKRFKHAEAFWIT